MRATIDTLETNNKITNIIDLHRGIKDFKKAYQPGINIVKGEKSYLVTGPTIQHDSKRWTQFHTSIFPEIYMVCG